jgi:hypothetical protein
MDAPEPAPASAPARRSRTLWIVGGLVALVAVVAVAVGVFGVQTLFLDDEVSEAGPTFDSGASATESAPESAPTTAPPAASTDDAPTTAAPEATTTTEPAAPVVRTVSTGSFVGVDHPGSGTATVLTDGTQTFVRFEDDFSTDNGPDLFAVVYVGGERIELERLKGNVGAQNYELPEGIDPAALERVAVWCKRFDSTFTEAPLA